MRSTGLVLAAGGIALANEVVFAPIADKSALDKAGNLNFASNFNWRLVPATVILALVLGGIEKAAPDFAVGLGGLTLLAVLIVKTGNTGTPIENLAKVVTK